VKIIEKFIEGKNYDQSKCEDLIFTGDRFIAIIDGATSKNSIKFNGLSAGKIAADIIFKSLSILEKENYNDLQKPEQICEFIRKRFIPFYEDNNIDYINQPTKRIVASVVIYDNLTKKIIQVGDCLAIYKNNSKYKYLENNKLIDDITSNTRALYLSNLIETKKKTVKQLLENDEGRYYILPLLTEQLIFQNKEIEFGYECFDGTSIPKNMISVTSVECHSFIILSSDGYPKLFPTLNESENYLFNILKEDPLLYKKYKSTKGFMKGLNSFDDRAFISFFN
jgi:hypothetical protein